VARIPQEVATPVMYNWVTGGHSPAVELAQLQEWGYATAIIPGLLIGTVVRAMIQALARAGAPTPMSDDLRSPAALFATVGLSEWLAVADRFAG
jgi:2-methylisocitrate lyase-like PEP mutase family enzyme